MYRLNSIGIMCHLESVGGDSRQIFSLIFWQYQVSWFSNCLSCCAEAASPGCCFTCNRLRQCESLCNKRLTSFFAQNTVKTFIFEYLRILLLSETSTTDYFLQLYSYTSYVYKCVQVHWGHCCKSWPEVTHGNTWFFISFSKWKVLWFVFNMLQLVWDSLWTITFLCHTIYRYCTAFRSFCPYCSFLTQLNTTNFIFD